VRKNLYIVLSSLLGAFLLIQLVPYRISNPSTRQEPRWDSPRTRELAVVACFDCHSNQTKSQWYSNVAPVSWLLKHDVDEGRSALNFSEWNSNRGENAEDAAEAVAEGSMPPSNYTWFGLHSAAKLTKAERDELIRGLKASLGGER
jgi:mono/diheme cytochrome c family protein